MDRSDGQQTLIESIFCKVYIQKLVWWRETLSGALWSDICECSNNSVKNVLRC